MIKNPIASFILDATTTPILGADWITLANSLPTTANLIEVFNGSTTPISLAMGPAGSEVVLPFTVLPGGTNGVSKITLDHDKRFSLKPAENISAGYIVINLYAEVP